MNYKDCRTAEEINLFTKNERDSRCGYSEFHWNRSGGIQSTQQGFRDMFLHPRQNTFREVGVLEEELSQEEVDIMKQGILDSMQKSHYLKSLCSEEGE